MTQQEAYQQALSGNALNPNQAVSDVNQQRRTTHVAQRHKSQRDQPEKVIILLGF